MVHSIRAEKELVVRLSAYDRSAELRISILEEIAIGA